MLKTHHIIVGLLLVLIGCTEPVEVQPYDYTSIFTGSTQKSWKIRTVQIVREGKGTLTVPAEFFFDDEGSTCLSDDIYVFNSNAERGYVVLDGPTKCDDDDPDIKYEGRWRFSNASAILSIRVPALYDLGDLPFIVYQADENQLVLDIYLDDGNKNNYRLNFRPTGND